MCDRDSVHGYRTPVARRPRDQGVSARYAPSHPLLALQRAAGNRAVASAIKAGPIVVQRSTRDELLTALREAVRAGQWQEVATRLNGFNTEDIKRLAAGLSVGEAANTRAAVATYLAGWPQEQTIIAALDAGRAEVARIGRIYQAYEQAVRTAEWPAAVQQLHAMSQDDINARLRKLPPDSLRALCEAAPEMSDRISQLANTVANQRGVEIPDGLGRLVVGGRDLGAVRDYRPGGESTVDVSAPLAKGEGASIGARPLAAGGVTVAAAVPMLAPNAAEAAEGPISGVFAKGAATGAETAEAAAAGTEAAAVGAETAAVGTEAAVATTAGRVAAQVLVRVPYVALVALGAVATIGAGWAVTHTEEIEKKLGEFGGTLPPGGGLAPTPVPSTSTGAVPESQPAPKKDEDEDEEVCPPGTRASYGPLDGLGRATGVWATIRGRTWSGQAPQEDPEGFVSGISGGVGEQARAHLLARVLGGSGGRENLVPFGQAENVAMYHAYESEVETYVTIHPNACVRFTAVPEYEGSILSASRIRIFASDMVTGHVIVNGAAYNRPLQ